MIRMRNVRAVFVKQVWDTLKNLQVLVLFIVYPVVTFVMIQAMGAQVGDRYFFLSMFAVMHCVFTPMVSTAAAVSEEKEKNTLRILILSGVKPVEYLLSIALFIWIATQVTGFAFIAMGNCSFRQGAVLFVLFTAGCLPSTLLGLCIGLQARKLSRRRRDLSTAIRSGKRSGKWGQGRRLWRKDLSSPWFIWCCSPGCFGGSFGGGDGSERTHSITP